MTGKMLCPRTPRTRLIRAIALVPVPVLGLIGTDITTTFYGIPGHVF